MTYIYHMTHPTDTKINYIFCTPNLEFYKQSYKSDIYYLNKTGFLCKYIRENNINFDDLEFTLLEEIDSYYMNDIKAKYILQYDSINKGLNIVMTPELKKIGYVKKLKLFIV